MGTLEVFVSAHCASCAAARAIAEDVASAAPDLTVHVIDIDAEQASVPSSVVAVPPYVMDGKVIHLGNPSPEWRRDLLALLEKGALREASASVGHRQLACTADTT